MLKEEQKFLDLDMVAEHIRHDGDRDMFREAVRCYHIGSHRASIILVWMATAECLKRRFSELAQENDQEARDAIKIISEREGNNQTYEQELIDHALKCQLINDYEKQCLEFVRNTRSQCAHPTGIVPSAEAVRHILQLCCDVVLTRRGYRGQTFIENLVTSDFDDHHFLPDDEQAAMRRCRLIIDRIPQRLWPRITALAATKRPAAEGQMWRKNATQFFKVLLENTLENGAAEAVARGFEGFRANNPDFFATLVGLDSRVVRFWDEQDLEQARSRLRGANAVQINRADVEAWARICEVLGLQADDLDLLRSRLPYLARYLPATFVDRHSEVVFRQLAVLAEEDASAGKAAAAIPKLFSLTNTPTDGSRRVIQQIVTRIEDEMFRKVLNEAGAWRDVYLVQFLEQSESFLLECNEDSFDDIPLLFNAAKELARRNYLLVPDLFKQAVESVLIGNLHPDWNDPDSQAGGTFKRSLEDLLADWPMVFAGTSVEESVAAYQTPSEDHDTGLISKVSEGEIEATQDRWSERLGKELTREQAAIINVVAAFGASTIEFLAEQIGMDREASDEVAFQLVKEGLLEQQDESFDLPPHLKVVEESMDH